MTPRRISYLCAGLNLSNHSVERNAQVDELRSLVNNASALEAELRQQVEEATRMVGPHTHNQQVEIM
jgi:hypothetical protein